MNITGMKKIRARVHVRDVANWGPPPKPADAYRSAVPPACRRVAENQTSVQEDDPAYSRRESPLEPDRILY